ncbi:MAG: GntR family transcriptional regulator [Paenibacillus sp.]|nr:GntR family transcriptional regulator [Paenibacillus sp.]
MDHIPKLSSKAGLSPPSSPHSALIKQSYSVRDLVYDTLKQQILSLKLPPGTAISEKEIALDFQVSRTPVRESFVRLAQEGLLEVYPQRGTYVSLIQVDLVEEARFMREQLERAVIRLACEHFPAEQFAALEQNLTQQQQCQHEPDDGRMFQLDEEFHSTLFAGCNKSKTWTVIEQMSVHLNRSRMLRLSSNHHWDHLIEQHRSMVQAIQQQDAEKAEHLMQEHLRQPVTDLAVLRSTYPSYFQ